MITLICGYPRAGKTTYSKRFEGICPVIHLDNMGSTFNVLLYVRRITEDVVIDGVYEDPKDRIRLLKAYDGKGSRCICLDTPKEIRQKRIGHKFKYDPKFPIPTYEEGWDEIIVIKGDNDGY